MTTTTITPVTKISHEELKAGMDEILDEIIYGDDTAWQTYVKEIAEEVAAGLKMGMFKTWSVNNRLGLRTQARRRGAQVHGVYAGVDQWRQRNRTVRDGEKPFFIYGSPVVTRKKKNEDGEEERVQTWRKPPLIPVYDYSQTVCEDPFYKEPSWELPLAGGTIDTLHTLATTSPVPVRFQNIGSRQEKGWLDHNGIVVDNSQPITNQIWTLVHELAHHHLGHLGQLSSTHDLTARDQVRERAEQEAVTTQYLVFKMLGLDESVGVDITKATGQYLRSWVKTRPDGTEQHLAGTKSRRRLLKQRFKDTFTAAQQIVSVFAPETT